MKFSELQEGSVSSIEVAMIKRHEPEINNFLGLLYKVSLAKRPDIEARFDKLPKVVQNEIWRRIADGLKSAKVED